MGLFSCCGVKTQKVRPLQAVVKIVPLRYHNDTKSKTKGQEHYASDNLSTAVCTQIFFPPVGVESLQQT